MTRPSNDTIGQNKGCGVCRGTTSRISNQPILILVVTDRKVKCDRTRPQCLRCTKLNRRCDGYGMRLSWPRRNDRKRSMLGPFTRAKASSAGQSHPRTALFVNVSPWDIDIHYALCADRLDKRSLILKGVNAPPPVKSLPRAMRWVPHDMTSSELMILDYCTLREANSWRKQPTERKQSTLWLQSVL